MPHDAYPDDDELQELHTPRADGRARSAIRRASNRLQFRLAHTLKAVADFRLKGDSNAADGLLQLAVLDLSASGCDEADISERLSLPRDVVSRLLADGLNLMASKSAQSAEIVRAQADARLASISSRLMEIADDPATDTTSLIRALEVQARIASQRVDLYAAKVKQSESDLADLAADVLATARNKLASATAHPDGKPTLTVLPDADDSDRT